MGTSSSIESPQQWLAEHQPILTKLRDDIRKDVGGSASYHQAGGQCGAIAEELEAQWPDVLTSYLSGAYVDQQDRLCEDHAWVEFADGTILDLAADQFEEGDDLRLLAPGDPMRERYLRWQQIEQVVEDLAARANRLIVQGKQDQAQAELDVCRHTVFGSTFASEYRKLRASVPIERPQLASLEHMPAQSAMTTDHAVLR